MRWVLLTLIVALLGGAPSPPAGASDPHHLVVTVATDSGATIETARLTFNEQELGAIPEDGLSVAGTGGHIEVHAPAYLPAEYAWDGAPGRLQVTLTPRPVFALHLTGEATAHQWPDLLDLAANSAVNALVIDLKDETGQVYSTTPSGIADEVGASLPLYDLAQRATAAHQAGLYVIVRIVTFLDPATAPTEPSWAIWDPSTAAPYHDGWQWFLDPWDAEARRYILTLADDACEMGVDEIQFDYVRFPVDFPARAEFDGPTTATGRQEAITSFLAEARARLAPRGCATAADIFGFITSTPGEGGIGQQLEALAVTSDVLSPMVYPSHYSPGWYGFADPNEHPYEVVAGAVSEGQARMAPMSAVLRPWLQNFYYSSSQIRSQIRAVDERGTGWMLWNAASRFNPAAIPSAGALATERSRSSTLFTPLPLPESLPQPIGPEGNWLASGPAMARTPTPPTGNNAPPSPRMNR